MKNKTVHVVTNPELGWNCVVGVYEDKKDAKKHKGECVNITEKEVKQSSRKETKHTVTFEFEDKKVAKEFVKWYRQQGENDSETWIEEYTAFKRVAVDSIKEHENEIVVGTVLIPK
jgi:hypothetical protein